MRFVKAAVAGLFILIAISSSATADDLGFVTISSRAQLATAKAIFDHAFIRVDTQFLVMANSNQKASMLKEGLNWQAVIVDVDLSSQYVVFAPEHGEFKAAEQAALGVTIDLGQGIRLSQLGQAAATTLQEESGIKVRALSEMSIPFSYQPKAYVSDLSALLDYPSDSVASMVSQDSVYAFDARLQAFRTRYYSTDSVLRARDWIKQKFQAWGYTDVTTPMFSVSGYPCYNVKAVKLGTTEPDQVIVVGAHYDSYSGSATTLAPGADDNASGTVTVMELARVLKNVPLRKTVIFMAFSAEELGLYGAQAAAADFASAGTSLEVMYNYDMVAYEPNPTYLLNLQSGPNNAYLQLMAAAAGRVTALAPRTVAIQGNSDHYPFYSHGYNIGYGSEGDFNTPNYHTTHDSTTKLNFGYFTDVVKMAAAALAYTGSAAHPTVIDSIVDQGDGHGLEIFWAACEPDYVYEVRYGTSPGVYTYTVPVTPGACSQLITGLTEGVRYYFSVRGQVPGGYPAAYFTEASEMSLVNPRVPANTAAEPAVGGIILTWASNHEADLDHYNIYRKYDVTGDFMLLATGITSLTYTDQAVTHWVTYDYYITAVDNTGHESAPSAIVQGTPATFDKGILVVNETTPEYDFIPTPSEASAYYDTVFGGTPHNVTVDTIYQQALRRSMAGQYSSIFWFDDDIVAKLGRYSADSLRWFESYTTNTFMAGYTTIQYFSTGAVGPGHLLYDEFMLQSYALNYVKDFVGATGQNGWPSVQLDTLRGFRKMGDIPSLTARSGGQVIYTYHSATSDPAREGKPVGIAYDGPHGRRILLSFPMYYLTPASATGLIAAAKAYFHESGQTTPNGDLDGSGFVDITDLGLMIDYLFLSQPIPAGLNSADIDASCSVDIADLSYFVDYIFDNGAVPQPGCVQK